MRPGGQKVRATWPRRAEAAGRPVLALALAGGRWRPSGPRPLRGGPRRGHGGAPVGRVAAGLDGVAVVEGVVLEGHLVEVRLPRSARARCRGRGRGTAHHREAAPPPLHHPATPAPTRAQPSAPPRSPRAPPAPPPRHPRATTAARGGLARQGGSTSRWPRHHPTTPPPPPHHHHLATITPPPPRSSCARLGAARRHRSVRRAGELQPAAASCGAGLGWAGLGWAGLGWAGRTLTSLHLSSPAFLQSALPRSTWYWLRVTPMTLAPVNLPMLRLRWKVRAGGWAQRQRREARGP